MGCEKMFIFLWMSQKCMKVSKKENSFEQRKKKPDRCLRQFDQLKNKTMVEKKKWHVSLPKETGQK